MANNKVALQANFKTPSGALLNVYGETPEEFELNLKMLNALIEDIIATDRAVQSGTSASNPVAMVAQTFGATVISETPSAPAPSAGGAPSCKHGTMQYVAPNNKPWKGWFCPQPKEATDKCSPQFIKG